MINFSPHPFSELTTSHDRLLLLSSEAAQHVTEFLLREEQTQNQAGQLNLFIEVTDGFE